MQIFNLYLRHTVYNTLRTIYYTHPIHTIHTIHPIHTIHTIHPIHPIHPNTHYTHYTLIGGVRPSTYGVSGGHYALAAQGVVWSLW